MLLFYLDLGFLMTDDTRDLDLGRTGIKT